MNNPLNEQIKTWIASVDNLPDEEIFKSVAEMTAADYDRHRDTIAEKMGIRVATLDKERKKAQSANDNDIPEETPFPEEVDGDKLYCEIAKIIQRHIICEDYATIGTAALWILATYCLEVTDVAPIAWINAPEKRCGKTQFLTLIGRMSNRSMSTSNIMPAALFRSIEKWHPTMIIDEVDTFINRENSEIRGVLNAGHSQDNAFITRCVGDDNEPKRFNVFGYKALAGIGDIPDTIRDRSINLRLRRRMKKEKVERLRNLSRDVTDIIRQKCARWAQDNMAAIKIANVKLPENISDRAQDNWEILFKIAHAIGERIENYCFKACNKIESIESEPSIGEKLLADIKTFFEQSHCEWISPNDLHKELVSDPESIWASFSQGNPITVRRISNELKKYGITSQQRKMQGINSRVFKPEQFSDAFTRYLPN